MNPEACENIPGSFLLLMGLVVPVVGYYPTKKACWANFILITANSGGEESTLNRYSA